MHPHTSKTARLGHLFLLIATLIFTGAATAQETPQKAPQEASPKPAEQKQPDAASFLNLTPEQEQAILKIGHHIRLGMDAIREDKNMSETQKILATQNLIRHANTAVRAVLTPQQRKTLEELQAKEQEKE